MPQTRRRLSLIALLAATLAFGCTSDGDSNDARDSTASADGGSIDADGDPALIDGGADADTTREDSRPSDGIDPENDTCSEEFPGVFDETPGSEWPDLPAVPYEIVEGPDSDSEAYPLAGTFQGTVTLDSEVEFECPPSELNPDLDCSTDRAIAVDYQAEGESRTAHIAIPLPYDAIAWPESGADVEIEVASDASTFLTIVRSGESTPIVGLGTSVATPAEDDSFEAKQREFQRDHGAVEIGMPVGYDDRATALCLHTDGCLRVVRFEPLVVAAGEEVDVAAGASSTVEAGDDSYRIWHTGSYRRNSAFESGGACTDLKPPRSAYGIAREN